MAGSGSATLLSVGSSGGPDVVAHTTVASRTASQCGPLIELSLQVYYRCVGALQMSIICDASVT